MSGVTLSDWAYELLDGPTCAVLTTLNADGSPQMSTMWVARDGDELLFSTVRGRQKPRNIGRDPRVAMVILDPENPEHYLEVRGVATVTEDTRGLLDELSRTYNGRDYPAEPEDTVRLVIRLTPSRVRERR